MVTITAVFPREERRYFFDPMKNSLADERAQDVPMPKELTAFAQQFEKAERERIRVRVNLGTACNFSCRYCIQHAGTGKPEFRRTPLHKLSELVSGITHYSRLAGAEDGERLNIDFIGGEPLLYWEELTGIVRAIRSFFPRAGFGMITNGSLFTADKAKFCLENNVQVVLSHDGPGQGLRTLDPLAPRSESLAAFQLLARELHAPLCVNCVLTRDNHDLAGIYEYLCNRLHTQVLVSEGFPVDICDSAARPCGFTSLEDYAPLVADVCACLDRYHPSLFPAYFESLTRLAFHIANRMPPRPGGRCTAYLNRPYALNTGGDLLRCHDEPRDYLFPRSREGRETRNSTLNLRDIVARNMSMEDISRELEQSGHLADWRHDEACRGCIAVSSCLGGCPKRVGEFHAYQCMRAKALAVVTLSALVRCIEPDALSVHVEF